MKMNVAHNAPTPWRKKLKKACRNRKPALKFSPTAWAKLLWLRDAGPTEVGGFAICRSDDPLLVDEIRLVRQTTTSVTVNFDDESVADLFDELVDEGLTPAQFGRIWLHTHPGDSADPSFVDEETFDRCFSGTDWAVMFILARGGETYARLRFHVGPGGSIRIPVSVDWSAPFGPSDHAAWNDEYLSCVQPPKPLPEPDDIDIAEWMDLFGPPLDLSSPSTQEFFHDDGTEH